jgi:hypothetical protein
VTRKVVGVLCVFLCAVNAPISCLQECNGTLNKKKDLEALAAKLWFYKVVLEKGAVAKKIRILS